MTPRIRTSLRPPPALDRAGCLVSRRAIVGGILSLVCLPRVGRAAESSVPPRLQAKLTGKVAAFDRNLEARSGGEVRVVVARRSGDGPAEVFSAEFRAALNELDSIGGLPFSVSIVGFSSPASLVESSVSARVSVLVLADGRSLDDVRGVAAACAGNSLLTVGVSGEAVASGAVLGFEAREGRPQILINLARARKQLVDLPAQLLDLATIIEEPS